MCIWEPNNHRYSRAESLPLLDYLVLILLLAFGATAYQHVCAARDQLRASGGPLRAAVVCSRAAQTEVQR